jgi:hypothetical protein
MTIACDYSNPSANTLHFGESTNDEMCLTFTYRYPAIAQQFVCEQ